ncbi:hypothetical protein [Paraglaciecola sp. MB-3u-78]|uniref:hypothetical protein n=1 Tax=Paraglaciecola sp. MB-3u-78 TaxID=2058332 RepID=UPI000C33D0DC|nr:hypothetical protein [Paraglaciecola sp. MB-3u-78]PKH00057.1 hypothetical protein CXF95_05305 [Paraglaciecola sp. MB-3u-78]
MQQIESAQNKFGSDLLEATDTSLPLEIGLIFEDGIAVDSNNYNDTLSEIASLINTVSASMSRHSIELMVRTETDLKDSKQRKHICPQLPNFLQYIQLFNDGHKASVVTGNRGCLLENFTEDNLFPVLHRKHKALLGYAKCDEHWLVIVSGQAPPLFVEHDTAPNLSLPSIATNFSELKMNLPIASSFDKVYFFKCPTEAILLT